MTMGGQVLPSGHVQGAGLGSVCSKRIAKNAIREISAKVVAELMRFARAAIWLAASCFLTVA